MHFNSLYAFLVLDIPAVLLAGGLGTRIREETEFKPKPMVEIGGRPILWHIMKHLSHYGITRFVVCVGYKGDVVRDYFLNYRARNEDFTLALGKDNAITYHSENPEGNWSVTIAETGNLTNTGGRIKRVEKYIAGETFLCTYGDGLSDLNVNQLMAFHEKHGRAATVTAVRPANRFGVISVSNQGCVESFEEKPQSEGWINGGFFIFSPKIHSVLAEDSILEREPLRKLRESGDLMAFQHSGFWQPMDTFRESKMLNELWATGSAPWKVW